MSEKKKKKKESKVDSKLEEITSLLKKVQADFENYQKRTEKEKIDFIEYSCQNIIIELLPVLDSFDLALKHKDNKDTKAMYDQLWHILSSKGLTKIEALNKKFNPYLHEVLLQEKSDKEKGIILEELQTGYKLKDNVIRATKVKIAQPHKEGAVLKEKEHS